jgi:putative DNA methylase
MIEKDFDVPFVSQLALREKQIQQNYRPIIGVHKWFARRPGALFRSLLLSEFQPGPLSHNYFQPHRFDGIKIADPFMGGGIPLIEANRIGCDIVGMDINPMAYWIVRQEIGHLDVAEYQSEARKLTYRLKQAVGGFYTTSCGYCGSPDADVKYFIWVKTKACDNCKANLDLFPGYLIAKDRRHPKNVLVCPSCGDLNEVVRRTDPGECYSCYAALALKGPAQRNKCTCHRCGAINRYPNPEDGPPDHRMFAIEYFCRPCKHSHQGRFFKIPDEQDLLRYHQAQNALEEIIPTNIPDNEIPDWDETGRLHKWGYQAYWQMFNKRQLLGLELSCRHIVEVEDSEVRNALATNLSDLLRYQNMLCRYDTMALKSLDIFSIHGYPVGLIQCESNILGIRSEGSYSANIGSGGWGNMVEKYVKAKEFCERPFEVQKREGRKMRVAIPEEWIGETRTGIRQTEHREVPLFCGNAGDLVLPADSLDAVFTETCSTPS